MSPLSTNSLPVRPERILAIADLHLQPGNEEAIRCLDQFLHGVTRSGDALFIVGDLFDAWIGPEMIDEYPPLLSALSAAVDRGIWIGFIEGNRDFLLSEPFFQRAGVISLPPEVVVKFNGLRYLFLHGDQFCLKDPNYRLLYETTRQRAWQENILRLPRAKREEWVAQLRDNREPRLFSPTAYLNEMVTNAEVIEWCQTHDADALIYGHFHHQQAKQTTFGERLLSHWCLPEWNADLGYLLITADAPPQFNTFTP